MVQVITAQQQQQIQQNLSSLAQQQQVLRQQQQRIAGQRATSIQQQVQLNQARDKLATQVEQVAESQARLQEFAKLPLKEDIVAAQEARKAEIRRIIDKGGGEELTRTTSGGVSTVYARKYQTPYGEVVVPVDVDYNLDPDIYRAAALGEKYKQEPGASTAIEEVPAEQLEAFYEESIQNKTGPGLIMDILEKQATAAKPMDVPQIENKTGPFLISDILETQATAATKPMSTISDKEIGIVEVLKTSGQRIGAGAAFVGSQYADIAQVYTGKGGLFEGFTEGTRGLVTTAAKGYGVPTITRDVQVMERVGYPKGTPIDKGVEWRPLGDYTRREVVISPEKIGGIAAVGAEVVPYLNPVTAGVAIAGETIESVKIAKEDIPTLKSQISELTPGFTEQERIDFLGTVEGKEFKAEVSEYIKSLERRKRLATIGAGLGIGLLAVPGVVRGGRAAFRTSVTPLRPRPITEMFKTRVVGPKPVVEKQILDSALNKKQKDILLEAIKPKGKGSKLWELDLQKIPKTYVRMDKPIFKFLRKVKADKALVMDGKPVFNIQPKLQQVSPTIYMADTLASPIYKVKGGILSRGQLTRSRIIPKTTKFDVRGYTGRPLGSSDIFVPKGSIKIGPIDIGYTTSTLYNVPGRRVRGLTESLTSPSGRLTTRIKRVSAEDVRKGIGIEKTATIKTVPKYLEEVATRRVPILRKGKIIPFEVASTGKDLYIGKQFLQVPRKTTKFVGTDKASGTLMGIKPKPSARSSVSITATDEPMDLIKVFRPVKQTEGAGVKVMRASGGKKTPWSVTFQEQVEQVARIPKVKTPKPRPIVVKPQTPSAESYLSYPTYVGGGGKGVSEYYGKGLEVDVQTTGPLSLTMPIQQVRADPKFDTKVDFVPLADGKAKVKGEIIGKQLGRLKIQQRKKAVFEEIGAEKIDFLERQKRGTRIVEREKVQQRERLAQQMRQLQRQRTVQRIRPISRPQKPKQPRPRVPKPKTYGYDLDPTDYIPGKKRTKKEIEDELLIPFVRRRGKFVRVGEATKKEKALRVGLAKLRGTLAASLQLRTKKGEAVEFAKETREFRLGKQAGKRTLVQRAPRRLGRRAEVQEIISSRKAGRLNFI
jgi:hypothetical protein